MAWTEKDWQRLGDRMRASRRLAGFKTKEAFAAELKISAKTYGDIESGRLGKRKSFSWDTISLIEERLNWVPGISREVLDGDGFVDVESGIRIKNGPADPGWGAGPDEPDVDPFDIEDTGEAVEEFLRQRRYRRGQRDVSTGE